ncbi:ATPase, T2SS/T4P/T4SS family [Staphylothermus marinus]|nr:ATPase, T2SS/T4P/T4SS family [Staphylothermus marinus]
MESLRKILSMFSRRERKERLTKLPGEEEVSEAVKSIIVPAEPIQVAKRDPSWRIIESYYVYKPFVKIVIAETPQGPMYFVEEYGLTPSDKEVLEKLTDILMDEIRPPTRPEDIKDLKGYVFKETERIADKYREKLGLVGARKIKLLYYIERNLLGYGPIDPLMKDPNIEDISCNGVNIPIYVWHKKYESIPTNITFIDEDYLNEFVMKMAHMAGKHISIAFPILDAMLPEKHRLAATFGREVSVKGPTFTIRKFRERPFSVTEIIQSGVINSLVAAYLWTLIEHGKTAMIAGGTGVGKTTMLNVISMFIRPGMKIVTIEDTPEINLPHPNWVQLTSRETYLVGTSSLGTNIRLFDLVKLSLRYRPDYIIVGEVRGEEAFVLFQAMASVSYDTPVLIRDPINKIHLVKIGEFIDKFYEEGEERTAKHVNGYYVLSHDGFQVVWKPIKYVLRHRTNEIYEIIYEGGGKLEATGSHSVFVLDPDTLDIVEKPVMLLNKGEYLVSFNGVKENKDHQTIDLIDLVSDYNDVYVDNIPSELKKHTGGRNPIPLKQYMILRKRVITKKNNSLIKLRRSKYTLPIRLVLDEKLAFLFGAYIANGCVKERRDKLICFTFGKSAKNIADKVMNIMYEKFNIKPFIDDRGTYIIYEYPHTLLAIIFEKLLGRKLEEKKMPEILWSSPKSVIRAFFEGLRAYSQRTLRRRYTSYTTANKNLAYQLLWLARFAGFYSVLKEEKEAGKNNGKTYYHVIVYLDQSYRKPNASERVPVKPILKLIKYTKPRTMPPELAYIKRREFISRKTALKALEWIRRDGSFTDFSREYLRKIESLINGDIIVLKIKDVRKKQYKGYVYDISVPITEAFFGGNIPILLHNTGHGGLSTIHAETLDYAIKRLTSPPMNIPPTYMKLMNTFIHLQRVIARIEKGVVRVRRRATIVQEVEDFGKYRTIAVWDPRTDQFKVNLEESLHLRDIAAKRGLELEDIIDEIYRKATVLNWMIYKNIFNVWDVSRIIFNYYYDPVSVYKRAVRELEEAGREAGVPTMVAPEEVASTEELVGGTKEMGEATKELFERTRELEK